MKWCAPRETLSLAFLLFFFSANPGSVLASEPAPPIRIGILHSTSGTMRISEASLIDAALLAVEEINRNGGILGRRLEVIQEDGASRPEVFAEKAVRLIAEQKVCSIFGCWTSASRKAVLPIVERYNNLLWYPVQYEGQELSHNVIYSGSTASQQILPALDWALDHLGARRFFLVGSDYVFPRTANEIIRKYLVARGAVCAGEAYRPLGATGFGEIVADIARSKADVVVNTINGDSNLDFFAELHRQGLTADSVPVLSFSIAEDEVLKIGTLLMQGHYAAWDYFQSSDTAGNDSFVAAFKKKYGIQRVTDASIHAAYRQVHLFAKAVAQAGSTNPNDIAAAASGLLLQAPGGLIRIDPETHHLWTKAVIGRVRADGQFEIVWSSDDLLEPLVHLDETAIASLAADHANRRSEQVSLSAEDPEQLILALRNPSVARRRTASLVALLQHPKRAAMVGALSHSLGDADWLVRRNSAMALSHYGAAGAAALTEAYETADVATRAAILEAMSTAESVAGIETTIERGLGDKHVDVRCAAARAAARRTRLSPPILAGVVRLLQDDSYDVRDAALSALGTGSVPPETLLAAMSRLTVLHTNWTDHSWTAFERIVQDRVTRKSADGLPAIEALLSSARDAGVSPNRIDEAEHQIAYLRNIRQASERGPFSFQQMGALGLALFYVALLISWCALLVLRPYALFTLNAWLSPFKEFRIPQSLGGGTVSLRSLSLLSLFERHPRVLDAWVAHHLEKARRAFLSKETVSERQIYVPLPARIDNKTHDSVNATELRRHLRSQRWCLLITGSGGTGKTALACQIAHWSMAARAEDRFQDVPMIPVLLEPSSNAAAGDTAALNAHVKEYLRELIATTATIPETFVDCLLRKGRLLVIADDVPINTNLNDFPVSRLILTARSSEHLRGIVKTVISLLECDPRRLSPFLQAYLSERMPSAAFTDDAIHAACKRFEGIVRGHVVPVLFAKIYAEQLLASDSHETISAAALPTNVPELVLGFLNALNRAHGEAELPDEAVQTAAMHLAAMCVSENLEFGRASRVALREQRTIVDEKLLTHLDQRLKIIRFHGAGRMEIGFTLEPLGEYLAAMHYVRALRNDDHGWRSFIRRASRAVPAGGYGTRAFLLALRDCCLAEGRLHHTPNWVAEEISRLAGPAAENLENEVRIGALYSLTGPMAISEAALHQAVQLAVEEINASGVLPGRTLVLETRDGQSDVETFRRQAGDLITSARVSSIFGCWTSASRITVKEVVEEHDHLLWYAVQYEGFESSRNIIYTGATANQQILPALEWCLRELKPQKAFLIGSRYIFPWAANRIMSAYLTGRGVDCAGEEYRDLGERDFQDVAYRIVASGADVVLNTVNGDGNIFLFEALRNAGVTSRTLPVISFSLAENELKRIGARNAAGHYCAWNYFQSLDTEENRKFVDAFKRRYGAESVTDDPMEAAYLSVYLFAKAVQKAGSADPRAVREAVRGLEHLAPGGTVRIDPENQHTWTAARIGKIRDDGQFQVVWSSDGEIRPDPYLVSVPLAVDVSPEAYAREMLARGKSQAPSL